MGMEMHALFFDLPERRQGKHLESSGIRKDRLIPVHEPVQAAQLLYDLIPGSYMEMICIGQLHLGSDPAEVIGRDRPLDGCGRSDIHKYRRLDRPVDRVKTSTFRHAVLFQQFIHLVKHLICYCPLPVRIIYARSQVFPSSACHRGSSPSQAAY